MTCMEGADRGQVSMLPACVEDYVRADALVRVVLRSSAIRSGFERPYSAAWRP